MRVTTLLTTEDAPGPATVARTVEMRSAGAIWTADLAASLDDGARALPHQPTARLAPAARPARRDFVPLADVLPDVTDVAAGVLADAR